MTEASLASARSLLDAMTRRERLRSGGSLAEARERIASRIKVLPGTLYNLARNRLKRLDSELRDRLTAFAVRDLQKEIERLTHELELARQMGAHAASPLVSEIEKHLTEAKALLTEAAP